MKLEFPFSWYAQLGQRPYEFANRNVFKVWLRLKLEIRKQVIKLLMYIYSQIIVARKYELGKL